MPDPSAAWLLLAQDMAEAEAVQVAIEELQQGGSEARESQQEFSQLAEAQLATAQHQEGRVRAQMGAVLSAVEALHIARQLRKVFLEGKLGADEVRQQLADAGMQMAGECT
jgi:predicted negative regulator of RcsB-dependent stress response